MSMRSDLIYKGIYSTDASMYQITPKSIITPVSENEVVDVIRQCVAGGTPILARGAGTSLTGQTISNGVVIDLSKHLNKIISINLEENWAHVEAGIVCGDLNRSLSQYNRFFAPDPATLNRATIGGMIGSNSAGMRSVKYGMTVDHILELTVALSTGEIVVFGSGDSKREEGGVHHKTADKIRNELISRLKPVEHEIKNRFPKVMRRSGGYSLDEFVKNGNYNPVKLFCGSEGTLGVILSSKVRLTPIPKYRVLLVAHFNSVYDALRAAPITVINGASAAELLDGIVIQQARQHPLTSETCEFIEGQPGGVLVIEVEADEKADAIETAKNLSSGIDHLSYCKKIVSNKEAMSQIWKMRSSALGLISTVRGPKKPIPYIEDSAVPPEKLAEYVSEVVKVCQKYGQSVSMFGHASVGLIHIRPLHDLHNINDIQIIQKIQEEVFQLVKKYGGSWSGEHGDGIIRGGFNERFFGELIYKKFKEVKDVFDPVGLMNPGKILNTPPAFENLRFGKNYKGFNIQTKFSYNEVGGILNTVEQCTGVGDCRKYREGTMCPSYMATRDELHSTRGRANALRLALTGQLNSDGIHNPLLAEAMDSCLSCKACRYECPNGVDMAKLKAETLHQIYKNNGIPWRARIFSNIPKFGKLFVGPHARVINAFLTTPIAKKITESMFGIARVEHFPKFANQSLSTWHQKRKQRRDNSSKKRIFLFNEIYTEHYLPKIGQAIIKILEKFGYQVELVTGYESQRIPISLGLLDRAKVDGEKMLVYLSSLLKDGAKLIVCEPSSLSAFHQDLPDLVNDKNTAHRIAGFAVSFEEFLCGILDEEDVGQIFDCRTPTVYIIHQHCHEPTLERTNYLKQLLSRIPKAHIIETKSGCCGMAGSFGYQVETAHLSTKIAGDRLLPFLSQQSKDAIIVANGFSCRHQIEALTDRKALHAAEVLLTKIKN
jgi:FAD/FMN-containing dehydrogenase/Fe-S oxidoreductase